uniref:Uncharacterized protein n=1 Tax=Trichuris muris TaxID=70415 RepID=A0A5S6QTD6_TRIMR
MCTKSNKVPERSCDPRIIPGLLWLLRAIHAESVGKRGLQGTLVHVSLADEGRKKLQKRKLRTIDPVDIFLVEHLRLASLFSSLSEEAMTAVTHLEGHSVSEVLACPRALSNR